MLHKRLIVFLSIATGLLVLAIAPAASPHYNIAAGGTLVCAGLVLALRFRINAISLSEDIPHAPSGPIAGLRPEDFLEADDFLPDEDITDPHVVIDHLKAQILQMEREREETRLIAQELEQLTSITLDAAVADNTSSLLENVFKHTRDNYRAAGSELWLSADWMSIMLPTPLAGPVTTRNGILAGLAGVSGWEPGDSSYQHTRGTPVLGVLDSGNRLITSDEHSLSWLFEKEWVADREIRSFAALPLIVRGDCIGVLAVFSKEPLSDLFSGVLECYAQILAMSLASHSSLEAARDTNARLEVINLKQQEINKQLADTARMKSEFMATISHELRTPLNGILGFLGLIRDGMAETQEEHDEFIQGASASAERLMTLINDVLCLSEIEAGQVRLELIPVEPSSVIDKCIQKHQKTAQSKGIQVRCHNSDPVMALADPARLEQVVNNLLDNAVKFTNEGFIDITITAKGHNCLIEVQDTGIGIPLSRQHTIFDRFRQVDGSSTRSQGGTGLGLALTQNLVHLMGGNITVESPGENQGTLASVWIPIAPMQFLKQTDEPEGMTGREAVLVVEDDLILGRYITTLITKAGYRAKHVSGVADARKELSMRSYSAVTLDWSLGGDSDTGDSEKLLLELTDDPKAPAVILVTAYEFKVRQFCEQESLPYQPPVLPKPVNPAVFLEALNTICGNSDEIAA